MPTFETFEKTTVDIKRADGGRSTKSKVWRNMLERSTYATPAPTVRLAA